MNKVVYLNCKQAVQLSPSESVYQDIIRLSFDATV